MDEIQQTNKAHRKPKEKAVKDLRGKNPKAFISQSGKKASKRARRRVELEQHKLHVPAIDRTFGGFAQGTPKSSTLGANVTLADNGPPPVIVAIIGPPGVGKTTLIRSLVRRYTKTSMSDIKGPVTIVSGKLRRLTFIECPNDLGAMIDVCKVADLVLLMIDGSFGFEMEIFEALSALSSHGLPKIIAVLTHLDLIKKAAALKAQKTALKKRFWTEVYDGAKMFYLSGVMNGRYPDREILNLSRFINVAKFRPLTFRNTHSYFLADRLEDVTPQDLVASNSKADRTIALYGYLRGIPLRTPSASNSIRVHIPGSGVDAFSVSKLSTLPDPCPLPTTESEKRRKLSEKDRICHAPMSGGSGGQITVDGDTIYINTAGTFSKRVDEDGNPVFGGEGERMVMDLQDTSNTLGESLATSQIRLFGHSNNAISMNGSTTSEDDDDQDDAEEDEALSEADFQSDLEDQFQDSSLEDDEKHASEYPNGIHPSRRPFLSNNNLGKERDRSMEGHEDLEFDDDSEGEIIEDDDDLSLLDDDYDLEGDLSDQSDKEPKWKQSLASRALNNYSNRVSSRKVDWTKLIYSSDLTPTQIVAAQHDGISLDVAKAENGDDELFELADRDQEPEDHFRPTFNRASLEKWREDEALDSIRHFFITGSSNVQESKPDYDSETGEGFVDLENQGANAENVSEDDEQQKAQAMTAKKAELKRKFDQQYDDSEDEDKADFFNSERNAMMARLQATDAEFKDDTPEVRALVQGHKPGSYVRIEVCVPAELVSHFDPRTPVIVGGLLGHEESFGFVTVRLKKHRWYSKQVLKSNDPLILSMGWRRFQTVPIYSIDDGTRQRLLKYTPEHMHCLATFYGPISSPSTGFCAMNSLAAAPGFRISANGSVLDIAGSTVIVKKLKLAGTPYKIFKNTAFIKEMFNSSLEVAKFEGAQVRTVSGIRGQIKKALSKPEGTFRATFEDRLLASDIVVLKAWTRVEPREYYNVVASLLFSDKSAWTGMRLTGQVRLEEGVKTPNLVNSQYKSIDRPTRRFNPLKVPRSLQAALPYASKPKNQKPQKGKTYLQKRAVVLSPEEKKAIGLLQQISALQKQKSAARAEKQGERRKEKQKQMAKNEEMRDNREKRERKEQYRTQGMQEKRKAAAEASGGRAKKRKRSN